MVPQIQSVSKCKTLAHTTSALEEGEEHISLGQTCAFHKVCYLGLCHELAALNLKCHSCG